MREILRRAGRVFLVTTPDVVALKLAQRAYSELLKSGTGKNRVHVVLNRWEENDLGSREVEDFLHRPVMHLFPNDNRSIKSAVLRGETVPPKTELWKSFRSFAAKLAAPQQPSPDTITGRLKSLLYREAWR
jgi:Flp pilus assembly CpaE family ATPase